MPMQPRVTFTLFTFLLILASACGIRKNTDGLVGRWLLTQSLSDPGDGSGKWEATSEKSIIEFKAEGTVISDRFAEFKGFKISDSTHIEFAQTDGQFILYRYKVSGNVLEINPPCREACGFRFKRIKKPRH